LAHQSRICYITIDVNNMEAATRFWLAALGAEVESISEASAPIFQRLKVPQQDIRILLQLVPEAKAAKTRMHLDIESDDVPAEVERLQGLGAKIVRPVEERGFAFSVLEDPFGNEFCVLQAEYPDLLKGAPTWR
jgi:predicted enzyme related to lactoylglutathione lyase